MTKLIFDELCTKLCKAAGTPVPELCPDSNGNTAIAVTVGDVDVIVAHEPRRAPASAFLSVNCGPVPAGDSVAAYRALMEVNSLMMWSRGCSFGRNPRTGEIVLQYAYPLQEASAAELYECIRTFADVAQSWRESHFLGPQGNSLVAPLMAASTPS
jgi:hypothetical protein